MVRKKSLNSPPISLSAFFAVSRRCGESFTFWMPWSVQFASMTYVAMTSSFGCEAAVLSRRREEQDADEVRVFGFEHHDGHEDQHRHWRQQDGIGQSQPLPGHVHEYCDDQAGLQHHEEQDQRPSEIAVQAEVVDEIGAGAEDEQPSPDHEIELDRVLLTLCVHSASGDCVMHMGLQRRLLCFQM